MVDRTATPKRAAKTARATPHDATPHDAQPLRGRIPGLTAPQAQALRGFFAAPQRWLLGDGSELNFTTGRPGGAGETFHVDADGVSLALQFDASASAQSNEGLHWSDYVGRSRLLAWSLAHESALMRLSDALGVSLLPVEGVDDDTAADRHPLWLAFSMLDHAGGDGEPLPLVRGTIRFPADWLSRLIARAEPVYEDDPLPELGAWRTLPVPVSIVFDGPQLDAAAWRQLQTDDVILVGRAQTLRCRARDPKRTWPLAAAPGGWRIDGDARPTRPLLATLPLERDAMTDTESPAADGDAAQPNREDAAARALPVQIAFDIGQLELSVGELASLQPGYVFALPTHLEGANVTLRANGRAAGRGEVVAVGDTLGVRLLSWS